MKKQLLLFAALMITSLGQAQSLTQANEPAIGSSATMFLCDSFAVTYDGVTGSGVTWDYSNVGGYIGETRTISVLDATTTAAADSFPGATTAIQVQNSLTTYFSSTATERISQGFLFYEPSFGEVYAMFTNDPELIVNYPFTTGNNLTDPFDGYIDFFYNVQVHEPINGTSYASVDGDGTLQLPGVSIPNVIRYKLVDTSYTNVVLLGNVELIRTQYEYYDPANSTLPLFTHTNLIIQPPGGSPLIENTVVLSSVEPAYYIGIEENELSNITVSPNPVNDKLLVEGDNLDNSTATLVDQSGRILFRTEIQNGSSIGFEGIEAGTYMLLIENSNGTTTKTVVKR